MTTSTNDLLARATEAGFRDGTVTVGGWNVSFTSGTDIPGIVLNVYQVRGTGRTATVDYCPECNGRAFARGTGPFPLDPAREAATDVAKAHGHLILFSETEAGQRSMRRALARAAGNPRYWEVA